MPHPYSSPLAEALAPDVLDRFVRYARIDTQSALDGDGGSPSTPGQLDLGRLLVDELHTLGLADAALDANGYVTATLPATVGGTAAIGLIAHVDVSPEEVGHGVEPLVHRDYDGGTIVLPRNGTVLDPAEQRELRAKSGHDIVTASGDTLLGADDKAGVAEIMAAVAHLAAHPELPRPTLKIAFTPDEEIGGGADLLDLDAFGAVCAYTLDCGDAGELQDETFSAAAVDVTVHGHEVHPGLAAGKMVNAARLAAQVLAALPSDRLTPETTSGRDGFIHPDEIRGDTGRAVVRAIVRDFDDAKLEQHIALLRRTAEQVVGAEPRARLEIAVEPEYPNMRTFVERFPQVSTAAEEAIRAEGLEVRRTAIRGGTDGSRLSARGLPTPNLFTGSHEYHSVREWASLHDMASAAATVVRLAEVWTRAEYRTAASAGG